MAAPTPQVLSKVSSAGPSFSLSESLSWSDGFLGLTAAALPAEAYIEAAAKEFITSFYPALNSTAERQTLSSFYTTLIPTDISLNGNLVGSSQELQSIFMEKMPEAHYEVQSYDCHVLNPNYNIGVSDDRLGDDPNGAKCSFQVLVSGYVKYGTNQKEAKMRGFTETFTLVPNYEPLGKRYLIQNQNFRMVL